MSDEIFDDNQEEPLDLVGKSKILKTKNLTHLSPIEKENFVKRASAESLQILMGAIIATQVSTGVIKIGALDHATGLKYMLTLEVSPYEEGENL